MQTYKKLTSLNPTAYEDVSEEDARIHYLDYLSSCADSVLRLKARIEKSSYDWQNSYGFTVKSFKEWLDTEI